eukprot:300079-Pyramimonas_sp.AAC.1
MYGNASGVHHVAFVVHVPCKQTILSTRHMHSENCHCWGLSSNSWILLCASGCMEGRVGAASDSPHLFVLSFAYPRQERGRPSCRRHPPVLACLSGLRLLREGSATAS